MDGTVRDITPSRSDARGRIAAGRRNLFCIRLHFVLEERIGVASVSVERFLTIRESARRRVFGGGTHFGRLIVPKLFGDRSAQTAGTRSRLRVAACRRRGSRRPLRLVP